MTLTLRILAASFDLSKPWTSRPSHKRVKAETSTYVWWKLASGCNTLWTLPNRETITSRCVSRRLSPMLFCIWKWTASPLDRLLWCPIPAVGKHGPVSRSLVCVWHAAAARVFCVCSSIRSQVLRSEWREIWIGSSLRWSQARAPLLRAPTHQPHAPSPQSLRIPLRAAGHTCHSRFCFCYRLCSISCREKEHEFIYLFITEPI